MTTDTQNKTQMLWLGLFLGLYLFAPLVISRSFSIIYFALPLIGIGMNMHLFKSCFTLKKLMIILTLAALFICMQKYVWDMLNAYTFKRFLKDYIALLFIPIISTLFLAVPQAQREAFKKPIFISFFIALPIILLLLYMSNNPRMVMQSLNRPLLYLLLIFWGVFYDLMSKKHFSILAILFIAFFLVTLKSYSETVLMCLIFGLITIGLMKICHCLKWGVILLSYALLILMPFMFSDFFIQVLIDGIHMLPSSIPEKIFLDRLDIWREVSNHIMRNFWTLKGLVGEGFEATRYVVKMPQDIIAYTLPTIAHPHNIILQFWLEFGLAGIAAFGVCLTFCFHFLLKQDKALQPYWFAYYVSVFASMNVNFSVSEGWVLTAMIFSFFVMRDIFLLQNKVTSVQ